MNEQIIYDRACKGCYYLTQAGGYGCCNYIFMEGHRRPCPPGKACTVKTKQKKGVNQWLLRSKRYIR